MKIFFTFDPFEENKWNRNQLTSLIANLTDKDDSLKAVYVATRAEVNLATAYDVPEAERFSAYPKKLIEKELKKCGLNGAAVEVIAEHSLSLTNAIEKLTKFTAKNKADLVLISTNAKSLLPRLVFGSFAETLVHHSSTDLLVYHQKTKTGQTKPKRILYAHDFSAKGDEGLERACQYAVKWGSFLTVIHVSVPEDKTTKLDAKVKKTKARLQALNVEGEVKVESTWNDPAEFILQMAKDNHSAIVALSAQAGNDSLLGGNVVRKILRESKLPTLVLKI